MVTSITITKSSMATNFLNEDVTDVILFGPDLFGRHISSSHYYSLWFISSSSGSEYSSKGVKLQA